jgi:hypothetical protein
VLAEPLDLDRSAKMPYATLRHSLGNALAARGHAGLLDELEAQLERWITPTPAQEARVRELLDEDLGRFREEWGVDAWTGDVDGAGERLRLSAAS